MCTGRTITSAPISPKDQLAKRMCVDPSDWVQSLTDRRLLLEGRWSLRNLTELKGAYGTCSWVGIAERAGEPVVLKLALPHMEGRDEIHGLRFWNGDPTVRLLECDEALNAMLLERCVPGTTLRTLPEPERDVILAGLLKRLWRRPPEPHPFRSLSKMTGYWSTETLKDEARWLDTGLVREGLRLFEELARPAASDVLLATDLHAGNVLRAEREPWLVIDPKPFVGDPAYDATQHLFNCSGRMRTDPLGTIRRFSELLEVDPERVRLWMFARTVAEPRERWDVAPIAGIF